MSDILKTADRGVIRMKLWDSLSKELLFMFDSLSSVWGHSVHFLLRFSESYSHSFHPILIKLYGKHGNRGGGGDTCYYVFGDLSKNML